MQRSKFIGALVALQLVLASTAVAQVFDERFEDWPLDLRIRGTVVVAGSLEDPRDLVSARLPLEGNARVRLLLDEGVAEDREARLREALTVEDGRLSVERYSESSHMDLTVLMSTCDVLCWESSRPLSETERSNWLAARPAFAAHISDGGVVVAIGPNADLLGAHVSRDEATDAATGLGLLPDTAIMPGWTAPDDGGAPRLDRLAARPRTVAIGLAPDTALVLRGRHCTVVGSGRATFVLGPCEWLPRRSQAIMARTSRQQRVQSTVLDLTGWRRDAIDRTLEPFPAAEPQPPIVDKGTLLIVGGGGMPPGLMERFIELAGGRDDARLVYVPCSEDDEVGARQSTVVGWQRRGVKHATFIHTKDRSRANEDQEFLAPLKDATGIWFGGGRQWNFADSYYGTEAHRLMKDVLARGGVIGGSSAGASIQGRYLARATPIQNFEIMAPGYERGGLGFLSGVAIDQHFTQRGRQKDMTKLVDRYPQLLGIGLDEATAIEVSGQVARVSGKGRVFFYDRRQPVVQGEPDYLALPAGATYDLVKRRWLATVIPAGGR